MTDFREHIAEEVLFEMGVRPNTRVDSPHIVKQAVMVTLKYLVDNHMLVEPVVGEGQATSGVAKEPVLGSPNGSRHDPVLDDRYGQDYRLDTL